MKRVIILLVIALAFMVAPSGSYAIFNKVESPDYYEAGTRQAFRSQKWGQGKKLLDECWKEYGTMSVMNELMGWYYYHYKKYDRSRFYLVKSLRDDNTNTHSRELLAKVEEETHNYSSAICYINELLESNPYARGLWRKKIDLYRRQGNDVEANRLLQRLAAIYPNDDVVKKDLAYVNELELSKQKKSGDINGQLTSLRNIAVAYPDNVDYCMQYVNILLQTGRTAEALEACANGVRHTRSIVLMKKRAAILSEQGHYVEAINYLRDCERTYKAGGLSSTITDLEKSAAEAAIFNDPYTAAARIYSKQHSGESLKYLLNTAIARGYYDDALMYLADAKKGGDTEETLYKEYIINRRLGNKTQAQSALTKLLAKNPRNDEAKSELAIMKYENGIQAMNLGQYEEAIPELQYAAQNSDDSEVRKAANTRLYNCYFETKRYDEAEATLEGIRDGNANYTTRKAQLLNQQGFTDQALLLLAEAYNKETDDQKKKLIAYQYEEFALPYVKRLINRGMTRQADKAVRDALEICPSSNDLMHQALTVSDILGNNEKYNEIVQKGRELYPEDPFFIVKEAGMLSNKGDYKGALDIIRPYMDTFVGDSTLANAFAENSVNLASRQMKSQEYAKAMATIDTALVYKHTDSDLLYTKGLVFEKLHQYDSAYVYQQYYKPTLMDYRQHGNHLELLQSQQMKNEITVMYQTARPGEEDSKTSNAGITYTYHDKHDDYTGYVNYAGRDGASSSTMTLRNMQSGGTGIQIGAEWKHQFKNNSPWSLEVGAAWASKYFPQWMLRAQGDYKFKNEWIAGLHASYRRLHTYSRIWGDSGELDENGHTLIGAIGWEHYYSNLFQLGINGQKTLADKWVISGSVDAFLLKSKVYFNGQLKGQFFPIEGSRTHVYAVAGVGNAPQTELLDNAMEAGFDKVNTFVGAGVHWMFTKHISAGINGTWYTLYRSQQIQTGLVGSSLVNIANQVDYKNMFYVQGSLTISF